MPCWLAPEDTEKAAWIALTSYSIGTLLVNPRIQNAAFVNSIRRLTMWNDIQQCCVL